jgi:hypothetical protein
MLSSACSSPNERRFRHAYLPHLLQRRQVLRRRPEVGGETTMDRLETIRFVAVSGVYETL